MATKEEILSIYDSKEGAWFAYKEGMQVGYNEAFNSLRNQAAIAAMQGILANSDSFKQFVTNEEYKKIGHITKVIALSSCMYADALIEALKKK